MCFIFRKKCFILLFFLCKIGVRPLMLGYPPRADPRDQAPPPEQTPPGTRHPPGEDPPGTRHPPGADPPSPLGPGTPRTRQPPPPGKQTAAYGQRAAGTHPTGRHSCYRLKMGSTQFSEKNCSEHQQ